MIPSTVTVSRMLTAVACVTVVLAGCSSGGHPGSASTPAGSPSHSGSGQSPSTVLSLAASHARAVTSFTATVQIKSSGSITSAMHGTLQEQVKPTVLAHQTFTISEGGAAIPGGMQTLLTPHAIYLKMSALSRVVGKPWILISFSALKSGAGVNLAPLIRQLQANNPLLMTQVLPTAQNVHEVGTATVAGVATTEYSGSYNVAQSMSKLDPSMRKLVKPALALAGITRAQFSVWIDGQDQVRKLVQTYNGTRYQATTVIVITSINTPVHIVVPPASQVGSIPGL